MKIDFTKFEFEADFEGHKQTANIARVMGNMMKYGSSVLLDIGFEDLAREIYFSNGEVEIPQQYAEAMVQVVKESSFYACIKRELIKCLTSKS